MTRDGLWMVFGVVVGDLPQDSRARKPTPDACPIDEDGVRLHTMLLATCYYETHPKPSKLTRVQEYAYLGDPKPPDHEYSWRPHVRIPGQAVDLLSPFLNRRRVVTNMFMNSDKGKAVVVGNLI